MHHVVALIAERHGVHALIGVCLKCCVMCLMSKACCKTTIEPGVSLEASSLFLRGRCKVVYILPFSDPTLALLLVGYTGDGDGDELY
ncbi:hypothetical protein Hanom_Chr03g00200421 [Helianthus anomalus]